MTTTKQESKLIQALVREAQSGKYSSFKELYKTNVSRIYSLGLKTFRHSKQAAEELTKRVFVSAYAQITDYPESVTFILWLKTLAFNEIKKEDIEKNIEVLETGAIEKTIFELPADERIIFILYDVDKLPVEDIAVVTKYSPEDINDKLELARKSIMGKLNIKRLEDIYYKVSFLPQKSEPRQEFWNVIYKAISKTEQENTEKKEEKKSSIGEKLSGFFKKKT